MVFFNNSTRSYSSILKNINIKLRKGEIVLLLGQNGSGKSVISSILSGTYQPTNGKITILKSGKIVPSQQTNQYLLKKVCYIFNNSSMVIRDITMFEYMTWMFGLLYSEFYNNNFNLFLAAMLKWQDYLNISDYMFYSQSMMTFSKGMIQKTMILVSMLNQDCDYYIFDESATGLDQFSQKQVKKIITTLLKDRKGIIYISHVSHYEFLEYDQVWCINNGYIKSIKNLKNKLKNISVYRYQLLNSVLKKDLKINCKKHIGIKFKSMLNNFFKKILNALIFDFIDRWKYLLFDFEIDPLIFKNKKELTEILIGIANESIYFSTSNIWKKDFIRSIDHFIIEIDIAIIHKWYIDIFLIKIIENLSFIFIDSLILEKLSKISSMLFRISFPKIGKYYVEKISDLFKTYFTVLSQSIYFFANNVIDIISLSNICQYKKEWNFFLNSLRARFYDSKLFHSNLFFFKQYKKLLLS